MIERSKTVSNAHFDAGKLSSRNKGLRQKQRYLDGRIINAIGGLNNNALNSVSYGIIIITP